MSRSYRKPYGTEGYGGRQRKAAKKRANKKVRKYTGDLEDGSQFKQVYNSWDICDYAFHESENDKAKRK